MWYIVDVWWDRSDEGTPNDNFMVYANSESEAQKIAKKWGPPVDLTVKKVDPKYAKNAEDAISMFHKKKISVDFVVDKGGRMHRIKNEKIQGQISEISTKGSMYLNEGYTRFPTLQKLVQVQYTDPRNKEGGFKIHTEFDGPYVNDMGVIEGSYVMYEDENFPGNFIGVHVSNELSEEDGTPEINVIAMDRNKKLVRDRMAWRRRKSNAAINEAINEAIDKSKW